MYAEEGLRCDSQALLALENGLRLRKQSGQQARGMHVAHPWLEAPVPTVCLSKLVNYLLNVYIPSLATLLCNVVCSDRTAGPRKQQVPN